MFHIQTTPAYHLENVFRIEAMAYYELILQAALEYKLHGILPGTYSTQ